MLCLWRGRAGYVFADANTHYNGIYWRLSLSNVDVLVGVYFGRESTFLQSMSVYGWCRCWFGLFSFQTSFVTTLLGCPELIRSITQGGPDTSSSLPNQVERLLNILITLYKYHWVMSKTSFRAPYHLYTRLYFSRLALSKPVWELFFRMRNRNQGQKIMTLPLKSVNEECKKVGMLAILQICVFKPFPHSKVNWDRDRNR